MILSEGAVIDLRSRNLIHDRAPVHFIGLFRMLRRCIASDKNCNHIKQRCIDSKSGMIDQYSITF